MCHTHTLEDIERITIECCDNIPETLIVILGENSCAYKLPISNIAVLAHTENREYKNSTSLHDLPPMGNTYINPKRSENNAYELCGHAGDHIHGWDELDHLETEPLDGTLEFSVTYCNCHVNVPMLFLVESIAKAAKYGKFDMQQPELNQENDWVEDRIKVMVDIAVWTADIIPLPGSGHRAYWITNDAELKPARPVSLVHDANQHPKQTKFNLWNRLTKMFHE